MKKNLFNRIFVLILLMFFSVSAFGQNARTITGKVTDSGGAALPGVNVRATGTAVGVISGNDGSYAIEVPPEAKRRFALFPR